MRIFSIFQALRMSYQLHGLDATRVDSYAGFVERFHFSNSKNPHWTERQLRESYDLWQRDLLKMEVRAELESSYARTLLRHHLKGWSQ